MTTKNKKILIFNLTRLGDLLQSTPMLSGLRKKYPDAHITLFVNRAFEGICKFIPFYDELRIFDIKKFEPAITGKKIELVEIYRYIESLVCDMKKEEFDIVVNLTHSKLSAMFSYLLHAPESVGMIATAYGERQIKGPWINYFCNMVVNREYNRFNLVDIYTKSANCLPEKRKLYLSPTDEISKISDDFASANNLQENDFVVGFQPGSSRKDRRWSTESFATLGHNLQNKLGAKLVLFGTSAEEDIGEEIYTKLQGQVINMIAKTNLAQLIGTLKKIDILVTNDTGTMHIAAALGIKVVALFFAHALCYETGPYGEGHIMLQADIACSPCSHAVVCNNMICKEYIKSDDVFEIIRIMKEDEESLIESIKKDTTHFENVKVMVTGFDQDNMYDCLPIKKRKVTDRDVVGMVLKEVWKTILDNKTPQNPIVREKLIQHITNSTTKKIKEHFINESIKSITDILTEIQNAFKHLSDLGKEGLAASDELMKEYSKTAKNITRIKELGDKLAAIDENIEQTGMVNSSVRSLVQVFKLGKENLEGDDIIKLVSDIKNLYKNLYDGSQIVYEILVKIS